MNPSISLKTFSLALAAILTYVHALPPPSGVLVVNEELIYNDGNYEFKDLRIGTEGIASFWNTVVMRVDGTFVNQGNYYQTNKEGMRSPFNTSSTPATTVFKFKNRFMNDGIFRYDYDSAEYTPTFSAIAKTFVNNGDMFFMAGSLHKEPERSPEDAEQVADISFSVSRFFRNFGYIQVSGTDSHVTTLQIKKLLGPVPHSARPFIMNRGHIRLKKATLALRDKIRGAGCISITSGGQLILDDRIKYHNKQMICFDGYLANATLNIQVHYGARPFFQELHGFARNCVIKFTESLSKFEYSGSDLLFWTRKKHWAYKFRIGSNYEPSQFKWVNDTLVYNGDVSFMRPYKCGARA